MDASNLAFYMEYRGAPLAYMRRSLTGYVISSYRAEVKAGTLYSSIRLYVSMMLTSNLVEAECVIETWIISIV